MKIFNVENGVKKLYVQISDILYLIKKNIYIPTSIINKIPFNNQTIMEEKKQDFICFEKSEDINFFKNIDTILDFSEYRNLTFKQLDEINNNLLNEYNDVVKKINNTTNIHETGNLDIYVYLEDIIFKMKGIHDIYLVKTGKSRISFPKVTLNGGFKLSNNTCPYEIGEGLDSNEIYLYRKDHKVIMPNDKIPIGLYQGGLTLLITERQSKDTFSVNGTPSNSISEDGTKLIIRFNYNGLEDKQNSTPNEKNNLSDNQISLLKTLLKKFNKNK